MPPIIDRMARYVFEGDVRSDGRIHHRRFKPKQGESLSVYDIEGFDHNESCEHGRKYTDNVTVGRIHTGYGVLRQRTVSELSLSVIYDNNPPRHISIELPEDERRLEIAKALAASADFKDCKRVALLHK
mgnify:CR=1 FL=1